MNEVSIQHATKKTESLLLENVECAALEATILLAYTLKQSQTYLRTYPQEIINPIALQQFNELVARRIKGEPIAYITGHREFWSLDLLTNKDTLIPRPETELLIEIALKKIPCNKSLCIADLGTGSGAIALAIASERPDCTITATDVSENALIIAKKNAARLSINNINFLHGHWLEPLNNNKFDIIISNPPYIANNDPHLQQGDLRFEPLSALTSGHDGLDAIKNIIKEAQNNLLESGCLLLEHGYDQRDRVIALLKENKYNEITWHDDLQNQPRVVHGRIKERLT